MHSYPTSNWSTACFCTLTSICTPANSYSTDSFCNSSTVLPSTYVLPPSEPSSYSEDVKYPERRKAIEAEFTGLEANKIWCLVKLPPGKKPISCKWVFKVKQNSDGTVERYKARLVVRGFTQKEGVDYTETFSPVVKMTTIRCLVATAVKKGLTMSHLDVNNAFLNGDLNEDVSMTPPLGLHLSDPTLVCKLDKSLYGLRQASRQWNTKLKATLLTKGYSVSENNSSLFFKKRGDLVLYLAIYVDDILVVGNDHEEITDIKAYLDSVFKIKDLRKLHYFLGMEFAEVPTGMIVSQRKFTMDLLSEFNCTGSTPVTTPLDLTVKLSPDQGDLLSNASDYRRLVGKLNFLSNTRPDLSFCVQHLSQFMSAPRKPHWDAATHVLRYLSNNPSQGLLFTKDTSFQLEAFCNADWAACPNSRKSVSGFVVLLGGSLISWKSNKQHTVSLSSAEAEYRSLRRLTLELAWLSRLLSELEVPNITPIPVKCYNQAAIYIARNPVYHERTKHVELDCHFVRTKLSSGLISLSFTPSRSQLADVLTKPLTGLQHHQLLGKLGMQSPLSNLSGDVGVDDIHNIAADIT